MSENKISKQAELEHSEYKKVTKSIKDPVLLILRVHLYAEYLLERFLICCIPRADRLLESSRLSFSQKLSLASSFDLIHDSLVTALKETNRVRNECAHELHKKISISDVNRIGRSLGADYIRIRKSYDNDSFKTLSSTLSFMSGMLAGITHKHEEESVKKALAKKSAQENKPT